MGVCFVGVLWEVSFATVCNRTSPQMSLITNCSTVAFLGDFAVNAAAAVLRQRITRRAESC